MDNRFTEVSVVYFVVLYFILFFTYFLSPLLNLACP